MKIVLFLILFCLSLVLAENPGFKAGITQDGLNYANTVAMLALSDSVRDLNIPTQSSRSSSLRYGLSRMEIQRFTSPRSSMTLTPRGIKWTANGAGISMQGRFSFSKWIWVFWWNGSGRFDVSFRGISFSLTAGLRDSLGKPRLSASDCSCNIHQVGVQFSGSWSFIYNLFSGSISSGVKNNLMNKMCGLLVQAINTDANHHLNKLPMEVVVAEKFLLDYSMVGNPSFSSRYMETYHKGEVSWNGNNTEIPFSPAPFPTSNDTSRMLYFWVSDYMANSLGYAGYQHDFFQFNLTSEILPTATRDLLNTTCIGMTCIGNLIPGIGQRYPNTSVMFQMYVTEAPKMTITRGIISLNFSGNVDIYAQVQNDTGPFLLTIPCALVVNVTGSINGQLLKGRITSKQLTVGAENSEVGPVPVNALNTMVNAIIDGFVLPQLNAAGQKGLVLPLIKNIKFNRPQLSLQEGAVLIATDISYLSDAQLQEAETK